MAVDPPKISRVSLTEQVYRRLRDQLMAGQVLPGHRFKIRELAAQMQVSETPIREALLMLVHDHALEMRSSAFVRVREASLADYLEIRELRFLLEPRAAVAALPYLDETAVRNLEKIHDTLVAAELAGDFRTAVRANYDFHFGVYRLSRMPQLTETLERLWVQIGPMLNLLYPNGHPSYENAHQHTLVIAAIKKRDAAALKRAFEDDLIEGGRAFVAYLTEREAQIVREEY